jgi:hypothetical protein
MMGFARAQPILRATWKPARLLVGWVEFFAKPIMRLMRPQIAAWANGPVVMTDDRRFIAAAQAMS